MIQIGPGFLFRICRDTLKDRWDFYGGRGRERGRRGREGGREGNDTCHVSLMDGGDWPRNVRTCVAPLLHLPPPCLSHPTPSPTPHLPPPASRLPPPTSSPSKGEIEVMDSFVNVGSIPNSCTRPRKSSRISKNLKESQRIPENPRRNASKIRKNPIKS